MVNDPIISEDPFVADSLPQSASPWRSHWSLDPNIRYLNHGSFGACPIVVQAYQQQIREQLEREPLRFFVETYQPLLDAARTELGTFLGTDPQNLAFVSNATTGVNTVLRSLQFQPSDELLVTNHEYNACRNALNFVAERSGASIRVAEIPFPLTSDTQIIEAILGSVGDRTRLVLLDHVTSQTALVLPIQKLCHALTDRGIEVLVDGAHAPGMVSLDLDHLGATYYTGNCHKWLCAPKSAGFLYVQGDRQAQIRPLVISHGANSPNQERSRFHLEFDWTGTPDPSAYLSVPEAMRCVGSLLPGGWPAVQNHNHTLVIQGRKILCEGLGIQPPAPDEFLGSMATIPLPNGDRQSLQTALWERKLQVPLIPWTTPDRLLRISAQLYNTLDDYKALTQALLDCL